MHPEFFKSKIKYLINFILKEKINEIQETILNLLSTEELKNNHKVIFFEQNSNIIKIYSKEISNLLEISNELDK